jgi:hypothetical protein
MRHHRLLEFLRGPIEMRPGEIDKARAQPAHRIEHVHRALHDVGQMPPADSRHLGGRGAMHAAMAVQEREIHRAPDHLQRRLDGAGDGPDQRGLAGAGFAGQPVDLAAPDLEADAVDGLDMAFDAEVIGAEMRPQIPHREDRGQIARRRSRRCCET